MRSPIEWFASRSHAATILRRRILDLCRRGATNGAALYVITMLSFVCALLSAGQYLSQLYDHERGFRRELDTMLEAEHEPRRDEERFGMVATLLGPTNTARAGAMSEPADEQTVLRDRFVTAVAAVANALGAIPPRLTVAREHWTKFAQSTPERLDSFMSAIQQAMKSTALRPCPSARRSEATHVDDFGPAGCLDTGVDGDRFRAIVSSLQNMDESQVRFHARDRVKRAVGSGNILRLAIEETDALRTFQCDSPIEQPTFVQAYFVSVDNVLAIWQCWPPGRQTPFPASRMWAAVHYVEDLLESRKPEFESKAYLDFGGFGVVRTKCKPVVESSREGPERFLGAVCGDVTVPISSIRNSIANSQLVDAFEIDIEISDDVVREGGIRLTPLTSKGRLHTTSESVSVLASKMVRPFNKPRSEDASGATTLQLLGRTITQLPLDDGTSWLFVPLQTRGSTTLHGIVARSRVSGPSWRWFWFTTSFSMIAIGAVLLGRHQARRMTEGTIIGNLLRNLDVGIVMTDEDDRIAAVNDRALEILDVPLPRFGEGVRLGTETLRVSGDSSRYQFKDLIDTHIYVLDARGKAGPPVIYEEVVPRQRREGRSSTYYATLSQGGRRGKVIRVSAAPILDSRNTDPAKRRTFGILESANEIPGVS